MTKPKREPALEILLATYNGAAYLPELLDSLLGQDDPDFVLRARDDGSSDDTVAILHRYREKFADRMTFEPTLHASGSAKGNFALLMEQTGADHILWADQDDVWKPNRVAETRRLLLEAEQEVGVDTPVFVFTDLIPTDGDLRPLGPSYFQFKKINPDSAVRSLQQTLVCTPMLGCAAGINRSLLDLALPVPIQEVTGHDWWALLLAQAAGRVYFSRRATVLYRMHGGNSSGQIATSAVGYAMTGGKFARVRRGMQLRWMQARAVRDRLDPISDAAAISTIDAFTDIEAMPPLRRRVALARGGYVYGDLLRTAAMLAAC